MNEMGWAQLLARPEITFIPDFVLEVVELCGREDVALGEIARRIEREPASSTFLMDLANSSLLERRAQSSSVIEAATALGLRTVRLALLSRALVEALQRLLGPGPAAKELWTGAVVGGLAAQRLAGLGRGLSQDEALFAGLLKTAGAILIGAREPSHFARVVGKTIAGDGDLETGLLESFGFSQSELTAEILRRWRFPETLVEAVRWHAQAPEESQTRLASVLHLSEHYRRVFARPSSETVAGMLDSSRRHLLLIDEAAAEILSAIEMRSAALALLFRLETVDASVLEARRDRATELVVEKIIGGETAEQESSPSSTSLERRSRDRGLTLLRISVDSVSVKARLSASSSESLLDAVAKVLRAQLRRSDLVWRWSQDELLVVAPQCAGEHAVRLATSLNEAVQSRALEASAQPLAITISIGAAWDGDRLQHSFTDLLEVAGSCLAVAQEQGGNTVIGRAVPVLSERRQRLPRPQIEGQPLIQL